MVRESIARQLGPRGGAHAPAVHPPLPSHHASFARLPLSRGGDGDGACLIEPSVHCNHCGYCLSYGH